MLQKKISGIESDIREEAEIVVSMPESKNDNPFNNIK